MSVIMALYNQANAFFWGIVLCCIAVIYSFNPKHHRIRDPLLWLLSGVSITIPLFLKNTHPGFRLMFGCQNTFLKIWNYIRHMSNSTYTLIEIFFYFSHPAVVLGDRRPASLEHIHERTKELLPKLALLFACLYGVLFPRPWVQTLFEGFLFYLVVDCINEVLAIPLMYMSGFYVEKFFNKPYLASGPREFWSKRWNIWIQDFQSKNIFEPIKKLGMPSNVAVLGVCGFAMVLHEYQIYVAHLNLDHSGSMSLFFILHFTGAYLEIIATKWTRNSKVSLPSFLRSPVFGIALHTLWMSVTGHLFIEPFYSAWTVIPLEGAHFNDESWSAIELGFRKAYLLTHSNFSK